MFRNIAPEAIGISAEWRGVLPLAREAGFQGVDLNLDQVAK
ncbi:MAG: xylose isomerase, partial [Armatimonadetes bacterium CG_4_9_14_3_um_filter_58_7]